MSEPGRGGSCADPGPPSLPVGPRTRGGSLRDTVDGGGGAAPSPAGQMRIPWVWATKCTTSFPGRRRVAPGTRPRGLPPVLRRSLQAGVAPGLPRPPPRERSPGPTYSPRLRVPPPATRGRGCRELPARRTPSSPTPRALSLSREPGSPGRPLLEGGFPAESARSWAAPHASPGLALRGLDLESSEKPKVYQGVRVKITVKELLQQRRAHQAASGGTQSGGNSVHLSDPVPPSSAGLYFEPEPIPSTPNYFQPREFSSCVSCEESPGFLDQIFDSYLQPETHPDPSLSSMQSTPHYFPDSFQAAPFCFNQSLTPESPSDSSTLSGSLDYSYCPAQLPSYAAESHTALPQLDTRNCGHPSGDYTYAHPPAHAQYDSFSPASICCCASCEAERLDAFRASDCFSYPSTDYVNFAPSAAASSDFYKREANWDICYS
ncbi:POU class 2 homeobox associating factor 3 [Budorcas taxicolor]|uniref:POU class 2 homeobox associating factor 3 n=1 Tax=Budorcas taxicolor TaxID=37181 RepID=UPI0022848E73|nr:POU class 2 homeobox associating factor 3 [Budorcas taxicolor]